MATKSTKSSKTTTKAVVPGERIIVKEFKPSDLDIKYMGSEPLFAVQPDSDRRQIAFMIAFNWYSRFYGAKQAKEIFIQYLEYNDRKVEAKQLQRLDEKEIMTTYAWLARLSMRGLELTEIESGRIEAEIQRLITTLSKPEDITKVVEEKPVATRPNVQEIMKERAREAGGEFEGIFDEFLEADQKLDINGRVIGVLSERNILPQHISMLVEVWQKKVKEFTEVLDTKDKQLQEAYGHYTKTQIKQIIKFCEAIIKDLHSYSTVKKATAKPRARKAVPVEKIVKNLKYMKVFEDTAAKLKLESISPTKLHGASECFLYDSSKRKLIYLIADEYSKTFTVKGNTILGFDSAKSEVKTIRKPTILNDLMKAGKPASRKFFTDLTTVGTAPTGRMNDEMIILKAW
jgi:hypothetical protein